MDSREGNGSAVKTLPSHTIPPVTQANSWCGFQRTEREQHGPGLPMQKSF